MSCLALNELTLSEQAAVQQSCAAAVETRVRALLDALELPGTAPAHPPVAGVAQPGSSNPLLPAEHTAMESQCHDHPPLQVCHPGHRPMMFKKTGDLKTVFYVSCGACGVRTVRYQAPEAAAAAWAQRDVVSNKAVA